MPAVHRMGDKRKNGRATITSQATVFANFKPIAVLGDRDTRKRLPLVPSTNLVGVFIKNKLAATVGSTAAPRTPKPWLITGSTNVFIGG